MSASSWCLRPSIYGSASLWEVSEDSAAPASSATPTSAHPQCSDVSTPTFQAKQVGRQGRILAGLLVVALRSRGVQADEEPTKQQDASADDHRKNHGPGNQKQDVAHKGRRGGHVQPRQRRGVAAG